MLVFPKNAEKNASTIEKGLPPSTSSPGPSPRRFAIFKIVEEKALGTRLAPPSTSKLEISARPGRLFEDLRYAKIAISMNPRQNSQ